jgi:hypothetical protein
MRDITISLAVAIAITSLLLSNSQHMGAALHWHFSAFEECRIAVVHGHVTLS